MCGERIREARLRLGLSQEYLAARMQTCGVNLVRECISKIEMGERFVADFELLTFASVLRVSVMWLLGSESENDNGEAGDIIDENI